MPDVEKSFMESTRNKFTSIGLFLESTLCSLSKFEMSLFFFFCLHTMNNFLLAHLTRLFFA